MNTNAAVEWSKRYGTSFRDVLRTYPASKEELYELLDIVHGPYEGRFAAVDSFLMKGSPLAIKWLERIKEIDEEMARAVLQAKIEELLDANS